MVGWESYGDPLLFDENDHKKVVPFDVLPFGFIKHVDETTVFVFEDLAQNNVSRIYLIVMSLSLYSLQQLIVDRDKAVHNDEGSAGTRTTGGLGESARARTACRSRGSVGLEAGGLDSNHALWSQTRTLISSQATPPVHVRVELRRSSRPSLNDL